MAKVSPSIRSFNGGETSALMRGRTDFERYTSSVKTMKNTIAVPQGPAIARSGTRRMGRAGGTTAIRPKLVTFENANEKSVKLEFCDKYFRLWDKEVGLYTTGGANNVTIVSWGSTVQLSGAIIDAVVGGYVALSGFPNEFGVNGMSGRISAIDAGSNLYDVELNAAENPNATVSPAGQATLVFTHPSPYDAADLYRIRTLQDIGEMRFFCKGYPNYVLLRKDTYDWEFKEVKYKDGPYMPELVDGETLTPSGGTGTVVPEMHGDNNPATGYCFSSGAAATREAFNAFNSNLDSYWESAGLQTGWVGFQYQQPFAVDGYSIYVARNNADQSYRGVDYAPSTWTFEAHNGANWEVLDSQNDYVLYDNDQSVVFEVNNVTKYYQYRLFVRKCTRNGPIPVRVARLHLRSTKEPQSIIGFVCSDITNVNNGQGFIAGDVGRKVRVKGSDSKWREAEITSVQPPSTFFANMLGGPLPNLSAIRNWRLGFWSPANGWPEVGAFFEGRLWLAGADKFPNVVVGSVVDAPEVLSQTDTTGEVLDDGAIVRTVRSQALSDVKWLESDERGLLLGSGRGESTIGSQAGATEALSARNMKLRTPTAYGSSEVAPLKIANQVLFVPKSRRQMREMAYVFAEDGYKAPDMTQLASHIGEKRFVDLKYAADPHNIVWGQREDDSLVGLTYDRNESVVGWHQHDIGGNIISQETSLGEDGKDETWFIVQRETSWGVENSVELLQPFWDYGQSEDDPWFVDNGVEYEGDPTLHVYGLHHMIGKEVYGYADKRPVGPFTVNDHGMIELYVEAAKVRIGEGYESEVEIQSIDAGAQDGTAIAKSKRIHNISVMVWDTYGGQVGSRDEDKGEVTWMDIKYPEYGLEVDTYKLYTGILGPDVMPSVYGKEGTILFRKRKQDTTPFNVVALYPQMQTHDRG